MSGPDHTASLNPKNFKKMVKYIRNIEKGLFEKKKASLSEIKNLKYARKSIFANKVINED